MPVRRRFRRQKRKRPMRFRKRRGNRKFAVADGRHKEKVVYDLILQTVDNVAELTVSWLRTASQWQQSVNP